MNPSYVVHSASGLARGVLRIVAVAAVVTLVAGVLRAHWWWGPVVLVVLTSLSLSSLRAAWTRLRIDPTGVALSFARPARGRGDIGGSERRFAAWSVVHRVEVDNSRELVRVVLRADAPLPPWLQGRIVDPSDPDSGPTLERHVPGVDAAALHQAVLTVSPATRVVTAHGA